MKHLFFTTYILSLFIIQNISYLDMQLNLKFIMKCIIVGIFVISFQMRICNTDFKMDSFQYTHTSEVIFLLYEKNEFSKIYQKNLALQSIYNISYMHRITTTIIIKHLVRIGNYDL